MIRPDDGHPSADPGRTSEHRRAPAASRALSFVCPTTRWTSGSWPPSGSSASASSSSVITTSGTKSSSSPTSPAIRLKLARAAATRGAAEFIVFCGVHFMAESADILRAPHQKVILPDLAAGCSMADMADGDQLEIAWRELASMGADATSSRSPTSTRRPRSKPSAASTAASSARRPTPRR